MDKIKLLCENKINNKKIKKIESELKYCDESK